MAAFDRITTNQDVLDGQPCIRGMRISVRRVLEALALYPDREDLRREYPELEDEDIAQALGYAALAVDDKVYDLPRDSAFALPPTPPRWACPNLGGGPRRTGR